MGYFISTFATAWLFCIVMTPLVRLLAVRRGFVDHPDERKHHAVAVALGGGVAVFIALWVTCLGSFSVAYLRGWTRLLDGQTVRLLCGLFTAALVTSVAGVIDDATKLRARYKVGAQVLAALIVIGCGVVIQHVTIFGVTFQLGLLAVPLTVFWLVGVINAMNLIDGADGVASSVGIVLCLSVAVMSFLQGHASDTMVMLALAGALFGFLCYNFPPASIYLGDAGSMLIGLVVGTIAVSSSVKGAATLVLAVPVAIWAVPILDSGAAILRRTLTGRSLFCTDRGHLHHALLQQGWSRRGTLAFISALSGITCGAALLSVHFDNEWIAVFAVVVVLTILCATRIFGHVELALVSNSFRRVLAQGMTHAPTTGERPSYESRVRLQGTHEWDAFWAALTETAERYDLTSIKLTIHLPAMEEAYYAAWHGSAGGEGESSWTLSIPLLMHAVPVGRLAMRGVSPTDGALAPLAQVVDFLAPLEDQLQELAVTLQAKAPVAGLTAVGAGAGGRT